jgi:hypothetical protein
MKREKRNEEKLLKKRRERRTNVLVSNKVDSVALGTVSYTVHLAKSIFFASYI